jgi:hypothetical protein
MPTTSLKRRTDQTQDRVPKRQRKFKKQKEYHSSSEEENEGAEEFLPVNLADSDDNEENETHVTLTSGNGNHFEAAGDDDSSSDQDDSENEEDAISDLVSETSTQAAARKRKRNDPEAFATSISKILGSKLSSSKRIDPVLARSKDASTLSKELADSKLEAKAKHKMKEERRAALEKGRVKDVLGLESADTSTAEIVETEKRLKKTAQRGVIKLFNAVRAAQVKGEEAARQAREEGVVGIQKKEGRVTEMSKKGFLELIAGGGEQPVSAQE